VGGVLLTFSLSPPLCSPVEEIFSEVLVKCIGGRLWLHIPDEMLVRAEMPYHLPWAYRLERDADVLSLCRSNGSVVGAFSARGATGEAVLRAAVDDRSGYPPYTGPEEHADSVRQVVKARMERPWERFLQTERRMLEARKNGQLAKDLAWRLPGESQKELDTIASEDRRTAAEGLVELKSEEGEPYYKHIDQVTHEYRLDRVRAELARIEWLLERRKRYNAILQSDSFEQRQSRKSQGSVDWSLRK
jgi:hypothetical protein